MDKFSTFNNAAGIQGADEPVGLRSTLPAAQANLRWTWNQVLIWMQSLLNINLLDRNQSNHIAANGAAGGGTPEIRVVGTDADIDLAIFAKGLGIVDIQTGLEINGNLLTNGSNIVTGGGDVSLGGGDVLTGGGLINTAGGSVVLGAGALTLSGVLTGDQAVFSGNLTAQVVNATALFGAPSATIGVLTNSTSMTSPSAVIGNLQVTGTLSGLTTVNIPTLTSSTAINANGNLTVAGNFNLVTGTLTAGATQGAVSATTPIVRVTTVGTAGWGVTLPPVGGVSPVNGRVVIVVNEGANVMSVWPATGAWIDGGFPDIDIPVLLNPGESRAFISIGFAVLGNWVSIKFMGEFAPSTFSQRYSATGDTFGVNDYTIWSDGAVETFTLPTAVGIGGKVYVLKNTGAGTLTLAADGAELIDGLATQTASAGDAIKVQSTGTGWIII
jgi:fibronectin-binding autotransporter adhesin